VTQGSSTRTLGSTTIVFGWVEKSHVDEMLHASDGFQLLLAITLAGLGASAAAGVALVAGALHPIAMYLVLCALLAGTAIPAIMTIREYRRYRAVRERLTAGTVQVPVPMMLVTPGVPTFSVGGESTVTAVTSTYPTAEQETVATASAEAPLPLSSWTCVRFR
jgi:hypothetical protein